MLRLALLLLVLPTAAAGQPRAVVTGTVHDGVTQASLPAAHLFLARTLRGTTADDTGQYTLDRIMPGAYRLVASMVGYAPTFVDTTLAPGDTLTIDLVLQPSVLALGGITVTAERDAKWARRLRKFERAFLGETPFADSVQILNPEVLHFEGGLGVLRAYAEAPLEIENRALGYRVQYHLKEFERTGTTVRYDGEPLFEPLAPATEAEAARWAANREAAYAGSLTHFLRALRRNRVADAGFRTFRTLDEDRIASSSGGWPLDPQSLLRAPTDEVTMPHLRFNGFVEIMYLGEDESPAFRAWQGQSAWQRAGPQRSWIELTDRIARIDAFGELADPYSVTVYGYLAFERVADQLPREYHPPPTAE